MYKNFLKRMIDFFISLCAIIIIFPLFIFIALCIKINSKGPVFFRQKRVGKNKKLFNIIKFRTMKIETPKDTPTHLLENPDSYITKFGKFLRKTSLDELPQIFNILKGDMAIVGPRPALYNQDDLVAHRDDYLANNFRPGLTGLAQVSGRDTLEIPLKARYDGLYVNEISFLLDIKLILLTIISVFKKDGIHEGLLKDNISYNHYDNFEVKK